MSEKIQHTAANMRERMRLRYDDSHHHKHNKDHQPYRAHCRSHPVQPLQEQEKGTFESTGLRRSMKLRKIRKRLDKGHIH